MYCERWLDTFMPQLMYQHTCTCTYTLVSTQDVLLEKFSQRQPSCEAYDEKMHFYTGVVAEIDAQPTSRAVEFARLNMEPLAGSLRENARQWVSSLGKRLNNTTRTKLTQLKTDLEVGYFSKVTNSGGRGEEVPENKRFSHWKKLSTTVCYCPLSNTHSYVNVQYFLS